MDRAVKYARRGDVSIAYQVLGASGPDLLFLPGFVSHLDLAWEEPSFATFLTGLGDFCRVIWFDRRGTGLSDTTPGAPTHEDAIDDINAVLDAAESARPTLFGVAIGAAISMMFALRHPERVRSLVLWAAHARLLKDVDYPAGWTDQTLTSTLSGIDREWADGYGIDAMNPTVAADARFRSWFARLSRAAATPAQARDVFRLCAATDLRPLLHELTLPTLLLHRSADPWLSIEHSRYVARRVPGAALVELPGRDHWPWVGPADPVLAEVEAFVTGVRRRRRTDARGAATLTPRERIVADLAVRGLSARDIGARLNISERTVETHITNVYAKLDVNSRLELVRRFHHLDR